MAFIGNLEKCIYLAGGGVFILSGKSRLLHFYQENL